jgi:glycosyltransferase involved in cell wall biosynthesis
VPEVGAWEPTRTVTVVMPYFQAQSAVEITLAALGEQTYPPPLMQVVIADDGSDPPLSDPQCPDGLDLQIVYQEDRGFGAPRARNLGARTAEGEIIVFADCDMVPEPGWVEAHARWHHLASDLVVLGFRRHVSFEGIEPDMVAAAAARAGRLERLFEGRVVERPEWIEFHMTRTDDLTSRDDDLFRVVTSGNMSLRRDWFFEIGAFDESFTQWGAEDTELGYRAFARGSVLVPDRQALAWHQGLGTTPDDSETVSLEQQRAKIAHLIAQRGFRRAVPGRSFTVPYVVVTVEAGDTPAAAVTETVERILGNRFHDLVVDLVVGPAHPHREWLMRQFQPDPRVTVSSSRGAGERWPLAARYVQVPPTAQVRDYLIDHLVDLSGDHGVTAVPLADGSEVVAVWGRAMQRVRRLDGGVELAADLFGRTELDWRDVGVRSPGSGAVAAGRGLAGNLRRALNSPDSRVGKVWRQTTAVRSPADAARVGRWVAGAVRQKVANRSMTALPPVPKLGIATHAPSGAPATDRSLAAQLGLAGPAAQEIFAVSSRPVPITGSIASAVEAAGGHLDVVLVDAPVSENRRAEASELGIPLVTVGDGETAHSDLPHVDLAPGIDITSANPIGWVYHAAPHAVAVPTKARLSDPAPEGVTVIGEGPIELPAGGTGKVVADLWAELRHVSMVEDRREMHASNRARAQRLIELSARGVPLHAPDIGDDLAALLGSELASILRAAFDHTDLHAREERSIWQRRAALRTHDVADRSRAVLAAAGLHVPAPPGVSVVLATNRPDHLDRATSTLADQTYTNVEVVVALHGDAFGPGAPDRIRSSLTRPVRVFEVAGAAPLGEVLNRAVEVAGGELIAKVDDDDFYGPEHLWDLVLAHRYSGAALIGKGAEFVYLAGVDTTIRRFVARAESYTTTIGGGALLISRSDLRDVGGWRRVPRQVDRALVADAERAGARVFRTHGFGYVLNRHGVGHTWSEGDQYFLDQAEDQRPGLDLAFAGVG